MRHYLSVFLFILCSSLSFNTFADETLTVSAPWELKAKDPVVGGYAFSRMGVIEKLIGIDKQGRLEPQLATSWSVSDDKKHWYFNIRQAVLFHDGVQLTAEHVAHSLQIALTKPGPIKKAPIKSIRAKNNQVVIDLNTPFSILPDALSHYTSMILSPNAYDKKGAVKNIIGTGPYKIANFQPPQRMDVIAFDKHWSIKPHLKKVSYLAISRSETRAIMAESKKALIAFDLDPASITRLKRNPKFDVKSVMLPRVIQLKVNNSHPFLSSIKTRQAISHAIERNAIAKVLMRAPEIKTSQLLPPIVAGWHNTSLEPFRYDVKKSKSLLKEAGWKSGKDGYLQKNNKVFEITLRTYPDRPELPLIANALQDQFKAIGIKLNVSITNYTEIPSGHQDGSLEMGLISRNYAQIPSPLASMSSDFSQGGSDWGSMNWNNAAVTKALAELMRDNTGVQADKNRELVVNALHQELPTIPVVWYKQSVVKTKNLSSFTIDPYESTYRLHEIVLNND